MKCRKYILSIAFFLITGSTYAQLNPWWVEHPVVDSSDVKRQHTADSIISVAKTYLGVPYVWGGTSPQNGFDCSGFICYVYQQFGIELPRTSGMQFDAGVPVPYNEAEKGDIILFTGPEAEGGDPGHVGIVLDYHNDTGFTFIHTSSAQSGGVRISNERDEQYYYKRFLEIRRVIDE